MAIRDDQILAWTSQGATQQSSQTYQAVRQAIEGWNGWPSGINKEIYLQGSYGNTTNIRGNSDVDIVVELTTSYQYDTSALSSTELQNWQRDFTLASYDYLEFRNHVFQALRSTFGGRVRWGNKCINVGGENQRLNADVVPALIYYRYKSYTSRFSQSHDRGIRFETIQQPTRTVINYPKLHLENGQQKNSSYRTGGNFKPLVRAFKNARDYVIDQGLLADGITPSYFVECLLYNVPDHFFAYGTTAGFRSIVNSLLTTVSSGGLGSFYCQNGVIPLFGNTPEQWNVTDAILYILALGNSV